MGFSVTLSGISLYLQGTRKELLDSGTDNRYIPVPTGNSHLSLFLEHLLLVYPCTYRELQMSLVNNDVFVGISLYLQGTQ